MVRCRYEIIEEDQSGEVQSFPSDDGGGREETVAIMRAGLEVVELVEHD